MSYSFAGVTIQVMTTPHARDQGSDSPVRHIPGGSVSYIDLAGQTAETLSFGLYFPTFADYAVIKALVGTSGTLVGPDDSVVSSLVRLRMTDRFPSGIIYASADFVGAS